MIYGIARDQYGATLQAEGAELMILRNGGEVARAPIFSTPKGDRNFEVTIAIDLNRPGTRSYNERALTEQALYSIAVEMNGQRFFPIEANGTLRIGSAGERLRLDLNLGLDSDGDGLPDAWEEWQLYNAGKQRGANGWDLSLITRDGDFDGDGISNLQEYIAGTFASDAAERLELRILARSATEVRFEFFTITGKVYRIERSSDLQNWSEVKFSVGSASASGTFHTGQAVDIVTAVATTSGGVSEFYRLIVR
jgi:hypothetical protein